jgi:predicted transcriptional regulator
MTRLKPLGLSEEDRRNPVEGIVPDRVQKLIDLYKKNYYEKYTTTKFLFSKLRKNFTIDSGSDGANKTSVMYKSFLSYAQLKEYLSFMVEKGLVGKFAQQIETRHSNEKFVYKITGKGIRLLQISEEIESIVGLD